MILTCYDGDVSCDGDDGLILMSNFRFRRDRGNSSVDHDIHRSEVVNHRDRVMGVKSCCDHGNHDDYYHSDDDGDDCSA